MNRRDLSDERQATDERIGMPTKISIIGAAGTLGSCAAFAIATQGLADELVMIDVNENLLKCHALDIDQAAAGLHDVEVRCGSFPDLAGSRIVLMAAGAPYRSISDRMELLNDSMPILREMGTQLARYCPDAVVITATNPVDPLNFALHSITGMDSKKLLGYSYNDSLRFRIMVARELGVRTTQVEGFVIGEHGERQVMLFSSLKVDGKTIVFREDMKSRVRKAVPDFLRRYERLKTGRTSGWTSAVGLAAMVSAIVGDTNAVLPCSLMLDGAYGTHGVSASVPVKLGRQGAREVMELDLAPEERQGWEAAMDFLKGVALSVKKML